MYSRFVVRHLQLACLCLLLLAIAGCELTSSGGEGEGAAIAGVLVANQGNFSDANGSITVFDPATRRTTTMAGQLGSIIQSISVRDGRLFVASNTGNRIDVFDIESQEQVAQVNNVDSPRYFGWTSDGDLLATNLFANALTFVDPTNWSVVGTVEVGRNPEGILVEGSTAYVANHAFGAGNTISVVNLSTRTVTRTLSVDCDGPRFVIRDRQNDLWVVCTGQTLFDDEFNVIGTTDGALLVIDPVDGDVRTMIDVSGMIVTAGPGQDVYYDEGSQRLFAVLDASAILIVDMAENAAVTTIDVPGDAPIGAVAYDSVEDRIYAGRVPGFTVAGSVTMLSADGTLQGSFTTGVAPSHLAFYRIAR